MDQASEINTRSIFVITERSDIGLYEVPLHMSLLSNFHMCGNLLLFRAVFSLANCVQSAFL